ncbi:MAG: NBR1-Ig-like domain-containing protein [Pirellulales bacterium]
MTLITHGWRDNTSGWVTAMANAMAQRLPNSEKTSIWTVTVTDWSPGFPPSPHVNTVTCDSGANRFTDDYNGESIIKLDWSAVDSLSLPTTQVASAVADYLLTTRVSGKTWLDAPLHLIGHSRGASLVAALAKDLGQAGVWVDQVTYLDPVPVLGDYGSSISDTLSETVTNNVTFADNYLHRQPTSLLDPTGGHVLGTHEQELNGLAGGYSGFFAGHSNMHLWYQGTIDATHTTVSDGSASFNAQTDGWYGGSRPSRTSSGYYYSEIVNARPSDGVNYLLGSVSDGDRQPVSVTQSAWPNIIYLFTDSPNNTPVVKGAPIHVTYWYQDYDSTATTTFYLDPDTTPGNGNDSATDTRLEEQTWTNLTKHEQNLRTVNAQPGTYYVGAKITDGTHTRYAYAPGTVTILFDGATSVSKTIADNTQMSPDQHFTQKWTLQNTGTSTWTTGITGYTLNRVGIPDPLNAGKQLLQLNNSVPPGGQYTFSLDLVAPAAPGTYKETWQMYGADAGGGFGTPFDDPVTVQIVVPGTPVNQVPEIGVVTPSGTQSGNVSIDYRLFDQESDVCSIQVEYSPNAGATWYSATQGLGGSGTSGLTSLPGGSPLYSYVWASASDVGSTNNSNVQIRITPTDAGGTGSPVATGTFTILNLPLNHPPSASVTTPSGIQSGSFTISYTLTDAESNKCGVQVRYSPDGGSTWAGAHAAPGGDGTAGLASSPTGTLHNFAWDSHYDLGDTFNSTVKIRITPIDAGGAGIPATTGVFTVNAPTGDTTAPWIVSSSSTIVSTSGGTTESFNVTYADNVALDVSTLDSNDIVVTGPNGYRQLATFLSVDNTNNGTPRTATYQVTAAGGTWDPADNGAYNLTVQSGEVGDSSGKYMAAGTFGSFSVNIAATDITPPSWRSVGLQNITTAGVSAETFTVMYTDNVAVNVSTLDSSDIVVTGPNGYSQLATCLNVDNSTNGTPRTATYRVTAPNGTWDAADNGTYTVSVRANQVSDTNANDLPSGSLGTFAVNVTVTPGTPWGSPAAYGRRDNGWDSPENASVGDNAYAVANSWSSAQDWYSFGLDIPANATINGIEIKLDGTGDGIDYVGKVRCRVFWWDFALNQTDYLEFPATQDAVLTVGGPSDLWGRQSWAPKDFANDAAYPFTVQLTTGTEWHTARIDQIQAKVYYTENQPPSIGTVFDSPDPIMARSNESATGI